MLHCVLLLLLLLLLFGFLQYHLFVIRCPWLTPRSVSVVVMYGTLCVFMTMMCWWSDPSFSPTFCSHIYCTCEDLSQVVGHLWHVTSDTHWCLCAWVCQRVIVLQTSCILGLYDMVMCSIEKLLPVYRGQQTVIDRCVRCLRSSFSNIIWYSAFSLEAPFPHTSTSYRCLLYTSPSPRD